MAHRILIVDDVRVTLATLKAYLEERNLKAAATTSPIEALHLAGALHPDLVILDFEMPHMTGPEVCERLRANPRTAGIPILILSIRDDETIRERCHRSGATGFVRKADGREALLEAVAVVLRVQRRRVLRVPCRFTVGLSGGGRWLEGLVCDVSIGGMLLVTADPLEVGYALRGQFSLPGMEEEIHVLGEIVRIEESAPGDGGFGVQFLQASSDSIAALKTFVGSSI